MDAARRLDAPGTTISSDRPGRTRRIWVPGTDAGPGTMVVLPDVRSGLWRRALRLAVLVACFLAGGALATAAFPWVDTALGRAMDEVRSVVEAGFVHSSEDRTAAAPPTGTAPP